MDCFGLLGMTAAYGAFFKWLPDVEVGWRNALIGGGRWRRFAVVLCWLRSMQAKPFTRCNRRLLWRGRLASRSHGVAVLFGRCVDRCSGGHRMT